MEPKTPSSLGVKNQKTILDNDGKSFPTFKFVDSKVPCYDCFIGVIPGGRGGESYMKQTGMLVV